MRRALIAILFVLTLANLPGCEGFFPEAKLLSIAITPGSPSLVDGDKQQLTATATYDDGSSKKLSSLTWTSSDATIAAVDSNGMVTAGAVGSATISAAFNDVTGTTSVTVAAAALRSLSISPQNPIIRLASGNTQQFTATGTYSDASTKDLTSTVTWTSSSSSVASISTAGLATASSLKGTTTITATSGSVNVSTVLTVSP